MTDHLHKFIQFIVSAILLPVSFFVKRNNNWIAFGSWSGDLYNDNSKYLAEYLLEQMGDKFSIYWVGKKKIIRDLPSGIKFIRLNSLSSVYILLKCKYMFFTQMYDAMEGKPKRCEYPKTGQVINGVEFDGLTPRPIETGRYCFAPVTHKATLGKIVDLLHFAVEECVGNWLQNRGISFTSADLYKLADLNIDIQDTRLPDKSYDLIICNHVLEHVDDYQKALRELHRILSDNGMLICSFPIDPALDTVYEDKRIVSTQDRIKHFGQADHLRIFGNDSPDILRKAGFTVATIDEEINISEMILPLPGPADYDQPIVYICRKSR